MYILAEKKVTVQTIMGWFLFDIIFPPYSFKVEVGFKFNVITIIKTKTWLIYHGVKEYTKQNKLPWNLSTPQRKIEFGLFLSCYSSLVLIHPVTESYQFYFQNICFILYFFSNLI